MIYSLIHATGISTDELGISTDELCRYPLKLQQRPKKARFYTSRKLKLKQKLSQTRKWKNTTKSVYKQEKVSELKFKQRQKVLTFELLTIS